MLNDKLNVHELTVERCDKETDELIQNASSSFLEQPLSYLKSHQTEYIFINSDSLEEVGIDGLSLELDDVFGNYDAMFGLKLQKKYRKQVEGFFDNTLQGEKAYDLLFNGEDGLWDVNVSINDVPSYSEAMTIGTAVEALYELLSKLHQELNKEN
ncbi:branched-chain amino acid aminotransferase [Rossellomorea aquimaris]|uniref:branched-chain amino acid aminotransferase n=1 Tax=Rossellomorea aquimaris TaxID=189382 RepID=UPI001CD7C520|nr:branched-chain amino acid aminotransferase [Rossellomorea aquimaris]MCA1053883.1 branched-chain amino acid aminotransferase [Rossellomorea aquimaris]